MFVLIKGLCRMLTMILLFVYFCREESGYRNNAEQSRQAEEEDKW